MTDKTAIEKALRALYGWIKAEVEHFGATCPDDFIIEMVENALAALDAEKPAENETDFERSLLELSREPDKAYIYLGYIKKQYAVAYHAEQCGACKALPEES